MTDIRNFRVLHAPNDHEGLPYPADILNGARDISSPWGSMRAYEWGDTSGAKVLLIHGLSTPSPALAQIGRTLVESGCRVMIIDLWGRGFSDTPRDVPHDARLYTSQILLAISTSSVSWTDTTSNGFTVAGYSMGGALVMAFARWFPHLVNGIVLMAPGGLYQELPAEYRAMCVKYPFLFPRRYVKEYMRGLLNGPSLPTFWKALFLRRNSTAGPLKAAQEQSQLDVLGIVDWEIDHHPGFVHSVSSALRHAPVIRQHEAWKEVRGHLKATSPFRAGCTTNRLHGKKILLLLGKGDVVLPFEYQRDLENTLDRDNLEIHEFEGGHSFPIIHGSSVAQVIAEYLKQ